MRQIEIDIDEIIHAHIEKAARELKKRMNRAPKYLDTLTKIKSAIESFSFERDPSGYGQVSIGSAGNIDVIISGLDGFDAIQDLIENVTRVIGTFSNKQENIEYKWLQVKWESHNLVIYGMLKENSKRCKLIQIGEEEVPSHFKPIYKFECIEEEDVHLPREKLSLPGSPPYSLPLNSEGTTDGGV